MLITHPTSRLVALLLVVASLLCLAGGASAQAPAPLTLPNLDLRANGEVWAILRQANGGTIIGGRFAWVDEQPRRNLARFHPDGSLDPLWNPGTNDIVWTLAEDDAGAVLVGGAFTEVGGLSRARLAKVQDQGTGIVDPLWNLPANGPVFAMVVADDDAVIVGGDFLSIAGQARGRIAKLSTTGAGAVDPAWNPSANQNLLTLALDGDALYAGGNFTQIGGLNRNRVAKLSVSTGTVDPMWDPNLNGAPFTLKVDGNGDLLMGGGFTQVGGLPRNYLARVSGQGAGWVDLSWTTGANGTVHAFALDADGNIYIGGTFTFVLSQFRGGLAKLSPNGVLLLWDPESDRFIRALHLEDDQTLLVGGEFTRMGGQQRISLARVDVAGKVTNSVLDVAAFGGVRLIGAQPGGSTVVAGNFYRVNGVPRGNLMRLQSNGHLDLFWDPSTNGPVNAIAFSAWGDVFIAGEFTMVGGQSRNRLAKVSGLAFGAVDPVWDPTANSGVTSLVTIGDALYAGGFFTQIGGRPRAHVAKLATVGIGSADSQWNPSTNGTVRALAGHPAGWLYLGGDFTLVDSQPRGRLARVSADTGAVEMNWNPNANGIVTHLALGSGDSLYAAGFFTQVGALQRFRIARISGQVPGAVDPAWNPAPGGTVRSLVAGAGAVFVGGAFADFAGQPRGNLVKLAEGGTGAPDPDWNPIANGWVDALAFAGNGALLVGGPYSQIGGQPRLGLAALPPLATGTASLSGLQPSTGTLSPAFAPGVASYGLLVGSATTSVTFTASTTDPAATLTLNGQPLASGAPSGPIALAVGLNRVAIVVTAADGVTRRTYRINVLRQSLATVQMGLLIERIENKVPRGAGEPRDYRITLASFGQQPASDIQLAVPAPAGLDDPLWTCSAPGGCSPAAGQGGVATLLGLQPGQWASVDLSGIVDPAAPFIEVLANAATAGGAASTQAGLSDPANGIGIYRNGFD